MPSSRTDEADKIKVLCAGVDDWICKPFGLRAQLAIRIEVVLRRIRPVTRSRIVFNGLASDRASREVTPNGKTMELTAWEFKILYFFASHHGESRNRQQLIEKIWGWKCNDIAQEQFVSVHSGKIRQKMIQVDVTRSQFIW